MSYEDEAGEALSRAAQAAPYKFSKRKFYKKVAKKDIRQNLPEILAI